MAIDTHDPSLLVDLDRYPVLSPESEPYRAIASKSFVASSRRTGAAQVPGFVSPAGVAELVPRRRRP